MPLRHALNLWRGLTAGLLIATLETTHLAYKRLLCCSRKDHSGWKWSIVVGSVIAIGQTISLLLVDITSILSCYHFHSVYLPLHCVQLLSALLLIQLSLLPKRGLAAVSDGMLFTAGYPLPDSAIVLSILLGYVAIVFAVDPLDQHRLPSSSSSLLHLIGWVTWTFLLYSFSERRF